MPADKISLIAKLIDSLINPLLNVLGIILAIYITYKWYKLRNKVKAPKWAWEKYLQTLIDDDEFEEVARIKQLLKGKDYYDKISTPKGYKVRRKENLDLADRYEEMSFVINQSYIFTRKDNQGERGFEVKIDKQK